MNLNIKDFSGPLDLLLHMVKKHEMDIYEIDIKLIIDEYVNFIDSLEHSDLEGKSEYLIMAAELIHLKSKLLLGFDEEENDDNYEINTEEDLRNRLIEFEKYQNVSSDFRILEENRLDYFTKVPENLNEYVTEKKLEGNMDVKLLIGAFMDLQKRIDYKKPRKTKITKKELSVKDKMNYIKDILNIENRVEFGALFSDYSKEELVVTLLSVLELSKDKVLKIVQEKNFEKIFIEGIHE